MKNALFSPINIGTLKLRNRLVMAPMGTNFGAGNGFVSEHNINHYTEKARNGMALLIVEAMYVHQSGAHRKNALALTDDKYIPGLTELTESVHKEGAAIAAQLAHSGRIVAHLPEGFINLAPSAVPNRITGVVPHELSITEIKSMVECFANGALRAKKAGFDAVEIHAGHGYLIMQFLSPLWNKRCDEYGGNLENRCRFALEIVRAVKRKTGSDFPVIFRLSFDEMIPGGQTPDDSLYLAKELERNGVDCLHVSGGNNETPEDMSKVIATMYTKPGYFIDYARKVKKEVRIPVIAVGRLGDPKLAESVIRDGNADLVCLGRSIYADPQWCKKVQEGREDEITPCIACNAGCIERLNRQLKITCVQNPMLGRNIYKIKPAAVKKKVLVIGAGIAGLETAIRAAQRGHLVDIWEKSHIAGGQICLAAKAPGKEMFDDLINSRIRHLDRLGIQIKYGQEANVENVMEGGYDVVVTATGGQPVHLQEEWRQNRLVQDAWAYLANPKPACKSHNAVVIGAGSVGVETAHLLHEMGYKVFILEKTETPASNMMPTVRAALMRQFEKADIQIVTSADMKRIEGNTVYYMQAGEEKNIEDVQIILEAVGVRCEEGLYMSLKETGLPVLTIGNFKGGGTALDAVVAGCEIGLNI